MIKKYDAHNINVIDNDNDVVNFDKDGYDFYADVYDIVRWWWPKRRRHKISKS